MTATAHHQQTQGKTHDGYSTPSTNKYVVKYAVGLSIVSFMDNHIKMILSTVVKNIYRKTVKYKFTFPLSI